MSLPTVSIILPTYNRAGLLHRALESLVGLDYPNELYDVTVADNNSSDGTRAVVAKFEAASPVRRVRYRLEPRQGVHYVARKPGAAALIAAALARTVMGGQNMSEGIWSFAA